VPDVLMSFGLFDPERSGEELVDACMRSLSHVGAQVERTNRPFGGGEAMVRLGTYPPLNPRGGDLEVRTWLDEIEDTPRSLVTCDLFIDPERDGGDDPSGVWRRFREAAVRLAGDVRPLISTWGNESANFDLDYASDLFAAHMYWEGWVDPARFDAARRAQLDAALSAGPRGEWAGGWWWWPAELDDDPSEITPAQARAARTRSEAIWTAVTGRSRSDLDEYRERQRSQGYGLPRPRLMFWAADRDDERLLDDVRDWGAANSHPPGEVDLGSDIGGGPGWLPVQVPLDPEAEPTVWLDALRAAVAAVQPSWGALQVGNDGGVPGLDPTFLTIAWLENVWVRHDWIGDRLAALTRHLDGAHRETLAGGTLLVTNPRAVPSEQLADWCSDDDTLRNHLSHAAGILGLAARASRPD
jgi:hypothetical protein